MIAYYYSKAWHTQEPGHKKATPLKDQLPKPAFRTGWWVKFTDESFLEGGEMCGKIKYVVSMSGDLRYHIQCGLLWFSVPETAIECRMSPHEDV
jgi:hypothetical protein